MSEQTGHPSVEATGAKHGDTVRCVGLRDNDGRYVVGQTYQVREHLGHPCVRTSTQHADINTPCRGFGAFWEKVE